MRAKKTKACFSLEDTDHQSSDSAALVVSNDDLLTEILLWLPVISILRFKCVSRQWRSLLSHPTFTLRYDTKHFPHKSPLGLFSFNNRLYVPFDDEDLTTPHLDSNIIQSCNGLLLCCQYSGHNLGNVYYVFNPTTKQFVVIPPLPGGEMARNTIVFMCLAFHQTDCAHFKVVCILKLKEMILEDAADKEWFQIQTYESDTREWKISVESFSARGKPEYGSGVYWNGALHWAISDHRYMYFKIDVEELHSLPLPVEAMSSKRLTRYLGESRGHLHLIVYDENEDNILPLNVYEMAMDCSGWFVKYHVELDEIQELRCAFPRSVKPLTVIDVIRGEKDEDTFMVLMINGLYITYNVHNKSFKPISKLNNIYEKWESPPIPDTFYCYSQTIASL